MGIRFGKQANDISVSDEMLHRYCTADSIFLTLRNVTFVPGLFKIFDEILVNAADNKVNILMDENKIRLNLDISAMIQPWIALKS